MPFNPYMFNPRAFDPNQDYGITNPVPRMRQNSIFGAPTTPEDNTKRFLSQVNPAPKPDFSQPDDTQSDTGKYFDDMMKLRRPGPAVTAYQAALKEQPTDDNTEVSTPRKIMGTLAGIAGGFAKGPEAGVATANEIIDSPYKTAMRDYTTKMKALQESANLERDDNRYQSEAIKTARDFGLKHDEFVHKQNQDQFERGIKERQTVSGETTAQAATQRAATGVQEASTHLIDVKNRGSAAVLHAAEEAARTNIMSKDSATRAQAASDLTKYHNSLIDLKGKESKKVTPSQQNYALDVAYRQLAGDPRYKDFVHQSPNGFYDVDPTKVNSNSAVYQEFRTRAQALAQAAISKGTPFDDEEDDNLTSPWSATLKR